MKGNLQFRHILLAYDASEEPITPSNTLAPLRNAITPRSRWYRCCQPHSSGMTWRRRPSLRRAATRPTEVVRRLKHISEATAMPIQFLTRFGGPTEQILLCAQEFGTDLIIMGHRPRSRLMRGISRSTLARVLQDAECPVLIVP
jgi:nucleotide-binding universal stress UspA family protein